MRSALLVLGSVWGTAWLGAACTLKPEPADLVLLGGKIVTVDPARPEVQALAARDGIIVALGSDEQIRPYVGPATERIGLDGATAIPGFIEGHGHFTDLGRALMTLDLTRAKSFEEVVEQAGKAAETAPAGQWIVGRGWHQEKWNEAPRPNVDGYPAHDLLSHTTPRNPVLLEHASGHAVLVNALVLQQTGIDTATPDPAGGRILRDSRGLPTGVLMETAAAAAHQAYEDARSAGSAEVQEDEARREIELADGECLSKGVTSFQDAGSDFATVDRLRQIAEAGGLGVRLWVMLDENNDALERRLPDYKIIDAADRHLTVRAIKRWIDGALGSHSAWLLAPYADMPSSAGLNTISRDDLERSARIALDHGFQLCVHAIGDRGNRETLDLFERAFAARPAARELRWRIEHAQHVDPQDVPRFSRLGVVASMQAVHCTSDGPWVPERLGDRRAEEGAYVWRKLIDSGAVVSNGTDAPVEDVDPIANFYAAVTRKMPNGATFHPSQRMNRLEALRSCTANAAYAAFEEQLKGTLELGKLADIAVLDQDLLEVPEERILETQVLYTIVGGKVLYKREES